MASTWNPPISVFGDEVESDLAKQVEAAADQGIGYLEVRTADGINISEMTSAGIQGVKELLDSRGLGVSAIGSPVGKAAITGDFDIELQRLAVCIEAAQRLNTTFIRVFSYFTDGNYAQHRDEVIRRMSALTEAASKQGLVLVHENESYVYGDTPERCVDLIEAVGSESLQVCFDPANFHQVGVKPFTEAWPQLSRYVRHFHVKDAVAVDRTGVEPYPVRAPEDRLMASVRPAGVGDAELPELIKALAQADYSGYLTLEPHLRWYLPDATGRECLATAYNALVGLVEEARAA